jgi:hypothetical protein
MDPLQIIDLTTAEPTHSQKRPRDDNSDNDTETVAKKARNDTTREWILFLGVRIIEQARDCVYRLDRTSLTVPQYELLMSTLLSIPDFGSRLHKALDYIAQQNPANQGDQKWGKLEELKSQVDPSVIALAPHYGYWEKEKAIEYKEPRLFTFEYEKMEPPVYYQSHMPYYRDGQFALLHCVGVVVFQII